MKRVAIENIPAELRIHAQWVGWRAEMRPGQKKPTKVPYSIRTGRRASSTDRTTWCTFVEAVAALDEYTGIGFVFSADDPYAGMDIDDCRNPETGEIAAWAQDIIDRLNSYTEISPSGTGVKIIVRATKRGTASRKAPHFEMYDRDRYFTITGQRL